MAHYMNHLEGFTFLEFNYNPHEQEKNQFADDDVYNHPVQVNYYLVFGFWFILS